MLKRLQATKTQEGTMTIRFKIQGPPIAKMRPRFRRYGKTYDPQEKEKERWQWEVKHQLHEQGLFTGFLKLLSGPIMLRLTFYMPLPKSTPKKTIKAIQEGKIIWHIKKPDSKNLLAWVEDCLNKFIWEDDSQVCFPIVMKFYDIEPRTEIEIEEI